MSVIQSACEHQHIMSASSRALFFFSSHFSFPPSCRFESKWDIKPEGNQVFRYFYLHETHLGLLKTPNSRRTISWFHISFTFLERLVHMYIIFALNIQSSFVWIFLSSHSRGFIRWSVQKISTKTYIMRIEMLFNWLACLCFAGVHVWLY